MADKTLVCKDCGAEFVFTEGEQAFYAEKGFENEPTRCPECRKSRKQRRFNNNY
jgi:DNA-directed RNA polymerase subunit RPC12/RpoP